MRERARIGDAVTVLFDDEDNGSVHYRRSFTHGWVREIDERTNITPVVVDYSTRFTVD
jgi:hypothetical protein